MHSEELILKVREQYQKIKCIREVARNFGLSPSSVKYMVENNYERRKKRRGPKPILTTRDTMHLTREVRRLGQQGERVTATKLLKNLDLDCSDQTLRRKLSSLNLKYRNMKKEIRLTATHKAKRLELAKTWLSENHPWPMTVFTDESKFNLDGPDVLKSWMDESNQNFRNKRQQGGGSVMIWGMLLPKGKLCVFKVSGRLNSVHYINLLRENVKPILDNEFPEKNFIFQQDNAPVHKSAYSMNWLNQNFPHILEWPAKSPDLNIIENVWHMLANIVYDKVEYFNTNDLWNSIKKAVAIINKDKIRELKNLFDSMSRRLVKVIDRKGDIIDY